MDAKSSEADPVAKAIAEIRREQRERLEAEKTPPQPPPAPEVPEKEIDLEDLARGPKQVANTAIDAGFAVTAWYSRGTWPGRPPKVVDLVSVRCKSEPLYAFALYRDGKHEMSLVAENGCGRQVKVNELKEWLKSHDPEAE